MTFEDLLKDVRILLAKFRVEAEIAAAGGEDISAASALLCLELFQEAFNLPGLRDMNAERRNFPAIDLGDDQAREAFQITADKSLDKVLKCLQKFVEHELHHSYQRVRIFVTTAKQGRYRSPKIKKITAGKIGFDPKTDIFDCKDLHKIFATFGNHRLSQIARILHEHLDGANTFLLDSVTRDALEQSLELRFKRALDRSVFPEVNSRDEFREIARQVVDSRLRVSAQLRRRVLLRATRKAAVCGRLDEAKEFLNEAIAIKGAELDLLPARARLAQAEGDSNAAIRIVRDEEDPDCRSVLLSLLLKVQGASAVIQWFQGSGLVASSLTADGIVVLTQCYLTLDNQDEALRVLTDASARQVWDMPYLQFIRGCIGLASVFAKPDRSTIIGGIPLTVGFGAPILQTAVLANRLTDVIDDLQKSTPTLRALGLNRSADTVEWFLEWALLLHPHRSAAAVKQLAIEVADPKTAIRRIAFGFEFLSDFDPAPIEAWIDRREGFGGLSPDELRAYLTIQMHCRQPAKIARSFSKHRAQYVEILGESGALSIELHSLIFSGDPSSARTLLASSRDVLNHEVAAKVYAEIATAEGADPITEYLRLYESTETTNSLRILVGALTQRTDHRALGKYAELLYAQTSGLEDAVLAASAYANAGDEANLIRVMEAHACIGEQNPRLLRRLLWALLNSGRLSEARRLSERLRSESPLERDLDLEVAIAIDTGHWEGIGVALSTYLDEPHRFDGVALIRAANLAQISGYGAFRELVDAAVAKGSSDPHVLIGAYSIAVEAGFEDDPKVYGWFSRAVELSDAEGPVRRFELKDLFAQQTEWSARATRVNDALVAGEAALFMAARALRTTLVDVVVGNLMANERCSDGRKRFAVPLFSGARKPQRTGELRQVAMDMSALLTLTWLGLAPAVFEAFQKFVVPFGTMRELFEARRSVRSYQKTRVARAHEIQALIASRLKVLRGLTPTGNGSAREIGEGLWSLLRAAESSSGFVVRPAPVSSGVTGVPSIVDMSDYHSRLADMHSLLSVLNEAGVISAAAERLASEYFKLQDSGWEFPARPRIDAPLYLDELAVSYLQTTKLLKVVVDTFDVVFVDASVEAEAIALLEMDRRSGELLAIIDEVRSALHAADRAGKIVFAPKSRLQNEKTDGSTLHILLNLLGSDAFLVDDRMLNAERVITDSLQHQAKTITTLDVIEELSARGTIDQDQRRSVRHRLRSGGAVLVPLDPGEVRFALERTITCDSAELRAIRESISLPRVRGFLRFPAELPWFVGVLLALKGSVVPAWKSGVSTERAAEIADLIQRTKPEPIDWVEGWKGNAPQEWAAAIKRVDLASSMFPLDLEDQEVRDAYHRWMDQVVLDEVRGSDPDFYTSVVQQLKKYVIDVASQGPGDESVLRRKDWAIFALKHLSRRAFDEVIADGEFLKRFGIPGSRSIQLTETIRIDRVILFEAFKIASLGRAAAVRAGEGEAALDLSVRIDNDGAGVVESSSRGWRFAYGGLLASEKKVRLELLREIVARHTLSTNSVDEIYNLANKDDLPEKDFWRVVEILQESPEEFSRNLEGQVKARAVGLAHYFPTEPTYWAHLTAARAESTTLRGFLDNELRSEQSARIAKNLERGFANMSLTFAAPGVVPYALLDTLDIDSLLTCTRVAAGFVDHVSLIGAFEICARYVVRDLRFVVEGEKVLDRLLGDLQALHTRCAVFAGIFALTTARLATSVATKSEPVFWRRLVAAAHASFVARMVQVVDGADFFLFAMRTCFQEYTLSVTRDMMEEPRWQPDWIVPEYLMADIFGRLSIAVLPLDDGHKPDGWTTRIAALKNWIEEKKLIVQSQIPAVLEGAPATIKIQGSVEQVADIGNAYGALEEAGSIDSFTRLAASADVFGIPHNAVAQSKKVLIGIRRTSDGLEDSGVIGALSLAAHIAVVAKDTDLAELIVEVLFSKISSASSERSFSDVVVLVAKCAAADKDENAGRVRLVSWLERLGFLLPVSSHGDRLVSALRTLQAIDKRMAPLLGRAVHVATLASTATG